MTERAKGALKEQCPVVGDEAVVLAGDEGLDADHVVVVGGEERVLVLDLQEVGDVELERPLDTVRAAIFSLVEFEGALASEVRYDGVVEHHLGGGVEGLGDGGDDFGYVVVGVFGLR